MERRGRWRRSEAGSESGSGLAAHELHAGSKEIDPREQPGGKQVRTSGQGRNSESFDPQSTLVRPDMRIIVGPKRPQLGKALRHDDILLVPEFFCKEDDWSLYYRLIQEVRTLQKENCPDADWLPWNEGAHVITRNPEGSPTFQRIVEQMDKYLDIDPSNQETRFNWYRDCSDWKPFHHDSAAFTQEQYKHQNITVGASFGTERELTFLHARNGTLTSFPQTNGSIFSFGKHVNIRWQHGIAALPSGGGAEGAGRISIIIWGHSRRVMDQDISASLLAEERRGSLKSSVAPQQRNVLAAQVCRDHLRGFCHYGDKCKQLHV